MINKKISIIAIKFSAILISYLFFNVFITSLLFLFHIEISYFQPMVAITLTVLFGYHLFKDEKPARRLLYLTSIALLIIISIFIASNTVDSSVDGMAYHQTAVGALRNGWNPIYQSVNDFNASEGSPVRLTNSSYAKWVDHYPKAYWFFAANIYKLTNNIESGKSLAWIVMIALFFIALSYFITKFDRNKASLLAILIAINPISITQLFSYYNDGVAGNLIFILLILLTMTIDKKYKRPKNLTYILIGAVITILINLKFTGLLFAGVYSMIYFGFVIINRSQRDNIRRYIIIGTSALFIGLIIIGASSYLKNFVNYGNPMYPLAGHGKVDIITPNEPNDYKSMGRIEKVLLANFSATDNITTDSQKGPQLKIPFTFNLSELSQLSLVDVRFGGYGVWFGGILLFSSIVITTYFVFAAFNKRLMELYLLSLPLCATMVFIIFTGDIWWARYFPQLYILPLIALILLFKSKRKILPYILTFMMLFNVILTWSIQLSDELSSIEYRKSEIAAIDTITNNGKLTPKVFLNGFGGFGYTIYDKYHKINVLAHRPDTATSDPKNGVAVFYKDIVVIR